MESRTGLLAKKLPIKMQVLLLASKRVLASTQAFLFKRWVRLISRPAEFRLIKKKPTKIYFPSCLSKYLQGNKGIRSGLRRSTEETSMLTKERSVVAFLR